MVPKLRTSPRARRRALKAAAALAVIAATAGLTQLLPGGKQLSSPAAPAPAAAVAPQPSSVLPKNVPLRPADRRAIDRALDRFVPAAVRRSDPALAYDLVTPALRAGSTRAEWATGTIPVQPFPAQGSRFHHWTLSYSHPNHVGLELLLKPTHEAEIGGIAFAVDLKRMRGRWLVDSFIPAAVFSGAGEPPRISAVPDFGPTAGASSPGSRRLDPVWILVPASLLVLSLVVLLGYGVATWIRGRRVLRDSPRALPPLPQPTRDRIAVAQAGRDR
jgi:hypothetical protein